MVETCEQPRVGKRENQGQDINQGWEKEKTQGLVKNKGGNSITSPNNNPGVCIQQLRVGKQTSALLLKWDDWMPEKSKHRLALQY